MDSGLAVPIFDQEEDLIDCINKAMAFLSAVASRFPPSNNQLRMSSNPINQATIQDGRVTVQQCTQPKRPRSSAWFKEKLMLAEAQEAGYILDDEQLAFIADPTKDLDAYDLDCDDISSAEAVLMENLSSCDSDVLYEVPYFDTYQNDMINQDVQEMSYSEQTHIVDFPDNEITSVSHPQISLQQKTGFGIVTSWCEEDLIREIDLYMPIYQCRLHIFRKIGHMRKTLLKRQYKVGEFIGFVV
ncbi:hypothetical protein Tco_1086953 [Tanacetum coccineum]